MWCINCGQASESIGGIGCQCPPGTPDKKILRRTDTKEAREFWGVDEEEEAGSSTSKGKKPVLFTGTPC